MFLNIMVCIVEALLGGWRLWPLLGAGTVNPNNVSLSALWVPFICVAILPTIVHLRHRSSGR